MESENYQVFLELSFMGRLRGWDIDSRVEVDVLQSLLREFGSQCLKEMKAVCSVTAERTRPTGEAHWIEFEFKLRGGWTLFVLEVRESRTLVLWDRARY